MSFGAKLFLAMALLVGGVTTASLFVSQRNVEETYRRRFEEGFAREVEFFAELQEARLAHVRARSRDLARSVRLLAALEEGDEELVYRIGLDELRDVLRPAPHTPGMPAATFFRLFDAGGNVVEPFDDRAGRVGDSVDRIAAVARRLPAEVEGSAGYLDVSGQLHEVVVTPVVDPVAGERIGVLAIGFPVAPAPGGGILLEGRLHATHLEAEERRAVEAVLAQPALAVADLDGESHRVLRSPIERGSGFPPVFRVGLLPLGEMQEAVRRLRARFVGFGAAALAVALGVALAIARGLSVPIHGLAQAAAEVGRGNLEVRVPAGRRDELGRLATAFNEMVEGLALKEKYRGLLDVVADRSIAEELLAGKVALGGQRREMTVLFCDIRNFTGYTADMPPEEVIGFLNEHMTALTRVIHDHHGVIDKFLGDGFMAMFGAPKSFGNDADHAVRAGLALVDERRRLDGTSRHRVAIGVGIATGSVVAGCMGSTDRLNYTAIGSEVNLAARLCGEAKATEVLVDGATRTRLDEASFVFEDRTGLRLKGFAEPVAAYLVRAETAP